MKCGMSQAFEAAFSSGGAGGAGDLNLLSGSFQERCAFDGFGDVIVAACAEAFFSIAFH